MGDSILLFPMIKKLSQKYDVDVLIEDKFIEITEILPKNVKPIPSDLHVSESGHMIGPFISGRYISLLYTICVVGEPSAVFGCSNQNCP